MIYAYLLISSGILVFIMLIFVIKRKISLQKYEKKMSENSEFVSNKPHLEKSLEPPPDKGTSLNVFFIATVALFLFLCIFQA